MVDVHALLHKIVELFEERRQLLVESEQKSTMEQQLLYVNDHAVADDASGIRVNEAGRQQMKFECLAVNDDGVAGIIASCAARDDVVLAAESVDDFALAFVAPLRSEHDSNVRTHIL